MADLVFVRANNTKVVKEGGAVSASPSALPGASGYNAYLRPDATPLASGQQGFATGVLSQRFRNVGYYFGATGYIGDNAATPTF